MDPVLAGTLGGVIGLTDGRLNGLLAENAIVQRSYDDLLITFKDSDDSVTIRSYFLNSVPTLDSINFSDGTTWNQTIIKTLTLSGTDGDDNLMAFAEGSHIDGGGGNDSLEGSLGDDYLDGGEGKGVTVL